MNEAGNDEAGRVAYLERYHEITQSLIGIARLDMTPEQRAVLKPWDDLLNDLQIERWHALGVPLESIGSKAMFYMPDDAVERFNTRARRLG